MGGCPGHRKVDGPGSRHGLAPSVAGRPRAEPGSGTRPHLDQSSGLPQGTRVAPASQGFHQTPHRGVGVYGEFYGIEGDGMEAGEIFAPVIFSGVCEGDAPTPQSLCFPFPF
jgi:hypothetical protein